MNTCRFCKDWRRGGGLIKYSVRHYAHLECAIAKQGPRWLKNLTTWQLEQVMRLARKEVRRLGLEDALRAELASRG
jgi:hypothetical protein